ncbi:MAG: DUF1499 domain-containing protein [Gammaproteobacteria bacterium]|nr:MAG: DUF1499 domain-containing protein [Gammaproteobacteria bacterium]
MKRLITGILITLLVLIGISGYALYANHVPWRDPPGFWARMGVYMSQNVAQTSSKALFPELRPRQYDLSAENLFKRLPDVMATLGWDIHNIDAEKMELRAVIQTRWLRFRDDITITTLPLSSSTSTVKISSASRIGRADYGANLGHILRFYTELEQ